MMLWRWNVAAVLPLVLCGAGCGSYPVSVDLEGRHEAALDGVQRVEVETRNGAIHVAAEVGLEGLQATARRTARGVDEADALAWARQIRVDLDRAEDGSVLRLVARFPDGGGRSLGVSFDLRLPPDVALRLVTRNGEVSVKGTRGGVAIDTRNGAIDVRAVSGAVTARTSNGAVELRDVDGDVDVATSNGRVRLAGAGQGSVRAVSSNGRIDAVGVRGNTFLKSSNGAVLLVPAWLPPRPEVHVETSNGGVEAVLPQGVDAAVEILCGNGGIQARFDGNEVHDLIQERHSLRARLNSGGGSVRLRTSNGSVAVRTAE